MIVYYLVNCKYKCTQVRMKKGKIQIARFIKTSIKFSQNVC